VTDVPLDEIRARAAGVKKRWARVAEYDELVSVGVLEYLEMGAKGVTGERALARAHWAMIRHIQVWVYGSKRNARNATESRRREHERTLRVSTRYVNGQWVEVSTNFDGSKTEKPLARQRGLGQTVTHDDLENHPPLDRNDATPERGRVRVRGLTRRDPRPRGTRSGSGVGRSD
jgi:hypothetical protein